MKKEQPFAPGLGRASHQLGATAPFADDDPATGSSCPLAGVVLGTAVADDYLSDEVRPAGEGGQRGFKACASVKRRDDDADHAVRPVELKGRV
jgi:hypothetical protein